MYTLMLHMHGLILVSQCLNGIDLKHFNDLCWNQNTK